MPFRMRNFLFFGFTIAAVTCVFFHPRIPQDPTYHLFADTRSLLGIANFLNVISNLPFLAAGLWGLMYAIPQGQIAAFREKYERGPYIIFFLGVALTCLGSGYYHLSPDNRTLLWDRLPMAIGFMGILAGTIGDRIGPRVGKLCLVPVLLIGIASTLYWYFSEMLGKGDLRPYIIVQFYTIAAVLLLIGLFPPRYTHVGWLLAGFGVYVLAKIFEELDRQIFDITKISGHSLKHLASAFAGFFIGIMLLRRKSIEK